jgi:5'(3')-deoxyribonucleotidase
MVTVITKHIAKETAQESRMKIILDMDGTTVDYIGAAVRVANKLWNIDLKEEEITHYKFADFILERIRDKSLPPKEIYKRIMLFGETNFYANLSPYEDTIETINKIVERGHEIIFLTKLIEPYEECMKGKIEWFSRNLKGIKYNSLFVTKTDSKKYVQGDIFVDDDPRNLLQKVSGRLPVCIERPWNKVFREENPKTISIKNLKDLFAYKGSAKDIENNILTSYIG